MIEIREALETDAADVCDVFRATYGDTYTYPLFYDVHHIKKMIFSDETVVFVAIDTETQAILGTASVIMEIGALSDLVSEFGRLAVRPEARGRHIGSKLMEARLAYVKGRNHVCLSETRVTHPFSARIGLKYQFAPVGFMPLKLQMDWRESAALMVQYFGNALALRKNHPRVIPEVYPLASVCMNNAHLEPDLIVDDNAPSYPYNSEFEIEEMNQEGYARLLRFERGRLKHREIFGPGRLHYGFFKLQTKRSTYLIARRRGAIVGAIGFTRDDYEKAIRIFELIPLDDEVVRFLIAELLRRGETQWGTLYIETDVSAYAPRMQRTLLELGFIPAAYVPALTFHHVERLDLIKMVRVTAPLEWGPLSLLPPVQAVADLVIEALVARRIVPRVEQTMEHIQLFDGLTDDQSRRVAALCHLIHYAPGETLFEEGTPSESMYLILNGRVELHMDGEPLPQVAVIAGEVLGEVSMLGGQPHSASAVAATDVEAAVLPHQALKPLIRRRPGLGLTLYRNLAREVAGKLYRSDRALLEHVTTELYRA